MKETDTKLSIKNNKNPKFCLKINICVCMQVVGHYGVSIPDISSAQVDDSGEYWAISNVIFHYLTQGDTINLNTLQVIHVYNSY